MSEFNYQQPAPGAHLFSYNIPRELVSLEINFISGGSWFEKANDRGKKHLLEHCIVSRTKKMNHEELKDWEHAESIGLNAFTSSLKLVLTASGHKSDFKKMLEVLCEMAFEPTFDQIDLDREKEIVLREISERRGDPNYKLYFDINKQVYTKESLELHETLGDPELVAQTILKDFYRLQKENLSTSQIIISIAGGGIDLEYTKQLIQRYLNNLNRQIEHFRPIDYCPPNLLLDFKTLPIVHEFAHEHVDATYIIPLDIKFDNRASRQIFASLFLNYGGVLYDKLRDQKQLVYGISYYYDISTQSLIVNFQAEAKLIEVIEKESKEVFNDFAKVFRADRFEQFKKSILKKQLVDKDNLKTVLNFSKNTLLNYNHLEKYDEFTSKLQSVSVDDIKNIYTQIQTNWDNKKIVLVSKNPL